MISVLLPYRDAEATLREALESVLADLDAGDEVVAVDDGSSDGSAAIARAVAAADPRVVLRATSSAGSGIVAALTCGLDAARGSFIGRMDADDVSLPGRFRAQRALFDADASLGAVGVQVEAFPSPREGMQRYVAWQNEVVTREDHRRAIFVESPLCHPSVLMRRDALDAVSGFRESAWAEDYDLWLRFDAAGLGLAKVPRVLFRWRMRPDSLTWTDPRYAPTRLVEARAHYLAVRLAARPFAVWGAGQTGRRLARALEAHAARPRFFVDVDPRKIGRTARSAPIVDARRGIEAAARGEVTLVVAVGEPGARAIVRDRLAGADLREGAAFICAA
ncbi:MAG: glycosyltransferase [Labilithrix sp.]|nr:glycosyltransferase [Labilithrix sp.]